MIQYIQTPDYYRDYLNNTDFLEHHGVKGMRWGHRKQQLINSGVSKKIAKKQVRLEKKQDRLATKSANTSKKIEKVRNGIFETKKAKYKVKLEKYSKNHDADKVLKKKQKYNKNLNEFAQTTKDYKSAGAKHKKIINDYYKNKISALNDKNIKKTKEYKRANAEYKYQRGYDIYNYGSPVGSMNDYVNYEQRARKKKTGSYVKNNKRYV